MLRNALVLLSLFLLEFVVPPALILGGGMFLATACGTPGAAGPRPPTVDDAVRLLETFGDAAVRLHLTDAAKEKAPQLFKVLDVDHDETLTLAELRATNLYDPVVAGVLLLAAERIVREERRR